jgi:hypothetical protein
MKAVAHAGSPSTAGSHGRSSDKRVATASADSSAAAVMYCSTPRSVIGMMLLLVNGPTRSSASKRSAACASSPSRSRMV